MFIWANPGYYLGHLSNLEVALSYKCLPILNHYAYYVAILFANCKIQNQSVSLTRFHKHFSWTEN
jgi:hypothetical protein